MNCPAGKYKFTTDDSSCLQCDKSMVPDLYWEWVPPVSGQEIPCTWSCISGYHFKEGSALSNQACIKCSTKPSTNPCKRGEFWSLICNATNDSGCVPCTGMLGAGVWTFHSNWTSSLCPYACARGYYDYNAGKGSNFAQPNCTICPTNILNTSAGCGLGLAFGRRPLT